MAEGQTVTTIVTKTAICHQLHVLEHLVLYHWGCSSLSKEALEDFTRNLDRDSCSGVLGLGSLELLDDAGRGVVVGSAVDTLAFYFGLVEDHTLDELSSVVGSVQKRNVRRGGDGHCEGVVAGLRAGTDHLAGEVGHEETR